MVAGLWKQKWSCDWQPPKQEAGKCGFGWLNNCYKPKCVRPARIRTAGLIITAELARQCTVDAAVLLDPMTPSVCFLYLIKICVCVICVLTYMLSRAPDGCSICERVGERVRCLETLKWSFTSLCCESALINFAFHSPEAVSADWCWSLKQ